MSFSNYLGALKPNWKLLASLVGIYILLIISVQLDATPRDPVYADVVFVFDTTGSMQDEINGLLNISSQFAAELESTGVDARLAMVSFGGSDEIPVIRETFTPSSDIGAFQRFLRRLRAIGGGAEDQIAGVNYALDNFTFRTEALRVLILITDEPLGGTESMHFADSNLLPQWNDTIDRLVAEEFTAYAVCINEEPFRIMTQRTNGTFYDINTNRNFTSLLLDIAENINVILTG